MRSYTYECATHGTILFRDIKTDGSRYYCPECNCMLTYRNCNATGAPKAIDWRGRAERAEKRADEAEHISDVRRREVIRLRRILAARQDA